MCSQRHNIKVFLCLGIFLLEQEDHNFEQLEYIGEYFVVVLCSILRSPSSSMGGHFLKSCMVVLLSAGGGDDADPLFHFPRA